ncbi:hypothetical protein O181_113247 [Austropuccinia psidii MF-1]|uniref:Uncharacterized protein n=1 Tax=Austropuccinia psidii MF-1 TaxID=1389203 RepID=A0A9Q3PV59_9BASI|nr:hypothetical protein [Austropuccinia psidii MF-1]
MGDSIRQDSIDEQDPKAEFQVEHQEEKQLEIQEIQFEAGMLKDAENKNLCKHTQDTQTFLVTPARRMAYINVTAPKMTVCIENAQHPVTTMTIHPLGTPYGISMPYPSSFPKMAISSLQAFYGYSTIWGQLSG